MTANDLDLLGEFIRDASQDAFTALVQRHLDLVYCAALRQVRSHQLAEEVAQSVFADLARNADRLRPDTILTAWLYEVTRRTAINVVRGEARRQLREHIAFEMNAINANPDDWIQIEPHLDDAMHALDETDRSAVLLRYFENKAWREVGQMLGTTDDTARKRVNRAVERLREFLANRGVTVGASGLAVMISTNSVQAAPIRLTVTISAVALAGKTTAAAGVTKAIVLTTAQKALIATALTVVVGAGIYEIRQASRSQLEVQTLGGRLAESVQPFAQESVNKPPQSGPPRFAVTRAQGDPRGSAANVLIGPVTNAISGHYYYLLTANDWTNSEAKAVSLGGHLVTINDAAENQWVSTTFGLSNNTARALWIGLNARSTPDAFEWSSGEPVTYTDWGRNSPSQKPAGKDCALITPRGFPNAGRWEDSSGSIWAMWRQGPGHVYVHGVVEIAPRTRPDKSDSDH